MFLVKWSLRSGLSDSMNSSAELYTVHSCLPGGSRRGEGEEERREGKGGQRGRKEGRKSEKEKKEGGEEREGGEEGKRGGEEREGREEGRRGGGEGGGEGEEVRYMLQCIFPVICNHLLVDIIKSKLSI